MILKYYLPKKPLPTDGRDELACKVINAFTADVPVECPPDGWDELLRFLYWCDYAVTAIRGSGKLDFKHGWFYPYKVEIIGDGFLEEIVPVDLGGESKKDWGSIKWVHATLTVTDSGNIVP